MRPRKLELPSLIKLLIDEHKESSGKLSRIEQLSIKGDYTETRKLIDELRSHLEQHKPIMNFLHQYIKLLDSPQSGINMIKELRKPINLHYEKEEEEIFPRILKLFLREKSV